MLLLLALACHTGGIDPSPGPRPDPPDSPASDSGDPPGESAATETIPSGAEDGCNSLFSQDRVPVFHVETDLAALQADYASGVKTYHPAVFSYQDLSGQEIRIEDAAIRLRGNPGFSWIGDKMQFNVSFNEYDPDGRFLGLRKLALDGSWYDPTVLRDRLAYGWLRRMGVAASCCNSAFLYVNGEPYGLYKNTEFVDQEFLDRNFGEEADGGLWKYGTELTANEEAADRVYVEAFWSHSSAAWQAENSDLESNLREWVGELVIPHDDGYWCCTHNFYLYEHPTRGAVFLPWDLDYSFDAAPYFADPLTFYRDNNGQPHFDAVVADPTWGPRFLEELREAVDAFDPLEMSADVAAWGEQTREAFALDAHTNFSVGEREDALVALQDFLFNRKGFLDAWVDCALGVDEDSDLDGFPPCGECDDQDPTIHPGAAEVCNGRDDDCDGWVDEGADCDTCVEHAWGSSRMMLCWDPVPWDRAQARCQEHGGNLGFPRDSYDSYVLWIHTYWSSTYWMGVYDWWAGATDQAREGTWLDPTGAPVSPAWTAGEPGGGRAENCAAWAPNSWTWADRDCALSLPSICRLPDG